MKRKKARNVVANLGQWLACVLLSLGIVIEVVSGADIGYLSITVGSLVFAVFTKLKYYVGKR